MDTYRAAATAMAKEQKWEEAVQARSGARTARANSRRGGERRAARVRQVLLRHAAACDKAGTTTTLCRCYLSAIVCYLYAQEPVQAEACFNDCQGVDAFAKSEECACAWELLDAYNQGSVDDIKKAAAKARATHTTREGAKAERVCVPVQKGTL